MPKERRPRSLMTSCYVLSRSDGRQFSGNTPASSAPLSPHKRETELAAMMDRPQIWPRNRRPSLTSHFTLHNKLCHSEYRLLIHLHYHTILLRVLRKICGP